MLHSLSVFTYFYFFLWPANLTLGFPWGLGGKKKICLPNAGDTGLIPGSVRSPRDGNGNPLQYPCLGKTMDREVWQAAVHGVVKSPT